MANTAGVIKSTRTTCEVKRFLMSRVLIFRDTTNVLGLPCNQASSAWFCKEKAARTRRRPNRQPICSEQGFLRRQRLVKLAVQPGQHLPHLGHRYTGKGAVFARGCQ